ncbi:MAG: hypothetical protein J6O56_03375 [Bacilli bacterium]|nr:hypothetical protein [Bacilli bacterium]
MNRNDIINNTFDEANEFINLVENTSYETADIKNQIPIAINLIFASELYLKVLILKFNNNINVDDLKKTRHNLLKLYNMIPIDKQKQIKEIFEIMTETDMLTFLDEVKDDFIDLRYMYLENRIKQIDMKKIMELSYRLQFETSKILYGFDYYKERYINKKTIIEINKMMGRD